MSAPGELSDRARPGWHAEVRLQGWDEFAEPVDRIVSIGAFEHFGDNRYNAFFEMAKFIVDEIFPGGQLPLVSVVEEHAVKAGFTFVTRVQPLRLHYARTLDTWASALEARRHEAIEIQSQEVYDRYLAGCAELFRDG